MSHSTEFIIDRAVTDADPTIVVTQIGDRDATQMGADSRANQDTALSSRSEDNLGAFIKNSFDRVLVLLFDFLLSESSDEDWSTIPHNLNHLCGREFGNVDLHVGVSIVSRPAVESADCADCVQSGEVKHACVVDGAEGVKLGSSDVSFCLVVDSVLIEPVVDGGLEIDVIAEVSRTGAGDKELSFIWNRMESIQLFIGPLIIFADQSKAVFEFYIIMRVTLSEFGDFEESFTYHRIESRINIYKLEDQPFIDV